MESKKNKAIDDYIAQFDVDKRNILLKIRELGRANAPSAIEKISYKIPSFHENGVIFYYAAFKNHFSIFPPIKGTPELLFDVKPYANEKGNLLFKYNEPIPFDLIEKVIRRRILENSSKKL